MDTLFSSKSEDVDLDLNFQMEKGSVTNIGKALDYFWGTKEGEITVFEPPFQSMSVELAQH